jgi:hypothetical protein
MEQTDFRKYLGLMLKDENFWIAWSLVSGNAFGGLWLIGGYVYRNLAHVLHDTPKPRADFDFIVEHAKEAREIKLHNGWKVEKNRYGNPKFVSEKFCIDYVPLANIDSIKRRGFAPTIENFLSGTPLTVQSVAFSIITQELVGDVGLKAILERTIGVNDKEQAEIAARNKGKSVKEYAEEKADALGFRAVVS